MVHADGTVEVSPEAVRQCAITRHRARKSSLLRLALDPSGRPFVDVMAKAPGRGVYVSPDREVLRAALTPKGLHRLFQRKSVMAPNPESVLDETASRLRERVLDHLALARRAGCLAVGVEECIERLARCPSSLVVLAEDVSERSAGRIAAAVGKAGSDAGLLRFGRKAEIGARIGCGEVGAVAVAPSVFHDRLRIDWERHRRLTSDCGWQEGAGTTAS
ncbi:MAG: DUF448 domain-containing protein [Myxococcota bacterium]